MNKNNFVETYPRSFNFPDNISRINETRPLLILMSITWDKRGGRGGCFLSHGSSDTGVKRMDTKNLKKKKKMMTH